MRYSFSLFLQSVSKFLGLTGQFFSSHLHTHAVGIENPRSSLLTANGNVKSYLFCSILESTVVRSEMEVVLRCKNYVQVDALTVEILSLT